MADRRKISENLDCFSQKPGSLLYRGPDGWEALPPGLEGDFLVFREGAPRWESASGFGKIFFGYNGGLSGLWGAMRTPTNEMGAWARLDDPYTHFVELAIYGGASGEYRFEARVPIRWEAYPGNIVVEAEICIRQLAQAGYRREFIEERVLVSPNREGAMDLLVFSGLVGWQDGDTVGFFVFRRKGGDTRDTYTGRVWIPWVFVKF